MNAMCIPMHSVSHLQSSEFSLVQTLPFMLCFVCSSHSRFRKLAASGNRSVISGSQNARFQIPTSHVLVFHIVNHVCWSAGVG